MNVQSFVEINLKINNPIFVQITESDLSKLQNSKAFGKLVSFESTKDVSVMITDINSQLGLALHHFQQLTDFSPEDLGFEKDKFNGVFIKDFKSGVDNGISMDLLEVFINKCSEFRAQGMNCIVFVDS